MNSHAFLPTDEQRRTVRAMAGFGIPQEQIATFLDIDGKTLRKHFRRELDRGSIEATMKVAQSLFRMATEGQNVAAAIFWMKARAGWSDRGSEDQDGRPVTINIVRFSPRAVAEPDVVETTLLALDEGKAH